MGFLHKPFTVDALMQKVHEILVGASNGPQPPGGSRPPGEAVRPLENVGVVAASYWLRRRRRKPRRPWGRKMTIRVKMMPTGIR